MIARAPFMGAVSLVSLLCIHPLSVRAQSIPEPKAHPTLFHLWPTLEPQASKNAQLVQGKDSVVSESLRVLPRMGVTFQSGPGVGYDRSLGSVYTFVPFIQTPGHSTFYTEGRFSLFTGQGNFGGNLRLGYRTRLPESNLVLGGYLGWDIRQSEFEETFNQLGIGVDFQGETWVVRANGYLPLGDTRREVANSFSDSGTTISDIRFSGNELRFSQFRQQTTSRLYEAAIAGFDLEGGYQLLSWEAGSLSAYGGLYFLDVPGGSSFVGGQGRLQVEVDNFEAGVALQSDGNFGTNVVFNVGISLGGNGPRRRQETLEESVIARLGSGVQRRETIAIDQQTVVETNLEQGEAIAINPATGEAWRFIHVTGGAIGGDGTVESPFGQVTEGVATTQTTGNDVVYVDAGTNPGMDGFTIPNNVQVLSAGVPQSVNTSVTSLGNSETEIFPLPDSGTGALPLIDGTPVTANALTAMVGLGENATLSGFDIRTMGDNENGVVASNVSGTTIDRNQIRTTGATASSVFVRADNSTVSSATISGNTLSTANSNAYGVFVYGSDSTIGTVTVSDNTITTTGDTGKSVYIKTDDGTTLDTVTIAGNSITTTGDVNAFGIHINASVANITRTTVSGNTISTTGSSATGIYVRAQNTEGTLNSATITGNTITTTGNYSDGIVVSASGPNATLSSATISGNTISTAGQYSDGIAVLTSNNTSTITRATVTDNTIAQAGAHSVVIQARNPAELICIAEFTDNTSGMPNVSGGGGNDINFNPSAGTPGTINFVALNTVNLNNTSFEDIVVSNGSVMEVESCP
ncbi:MAG: right-handed parallel beta-helix repeat-containing protein [Leptolyngbya sp. SIO1D8]|nr:right-handed parallel beta-helix repeat-containing protein [Leptolyngbya sp. SIO1D8]